MDARTVSEPRLVIDVRAATRRFGDRSVLDGVNLQVRRGEFVSLLGRSGSGKSTLLRILAALDDGAEGHIAVSPRRSVVFQDARLLPWARVLPNVTLGLDVAQATQLGADALREVGLGGHEQDWPKTLSGGEAQRAALARALVREPELMLLDEPFGALDALTRIRMHALLVRLCDRYRPGVLLVTHDVDEAILLADRVLVLDGGNFVEDVAVTTPRPRLQGDAEFRRLRSHLLSVLGIDERDESATDREPVDVA